MISESIRLVKSNLHAAFSSTDQRAKIQDGDFIVGLLEATADSPESFSLASLRLSMCSFVGETIGQSAFNERMGTATLKNQVQHTLKTLMGEAFRLQNASASSMDIAQKLGVSTIIGVDSSIVSLWHGLAKCFSGTFTTAALKLHLSTDLLSGSVQWLDLSSGTVHDSQKFPDITCGRLYIVDLGYWDFGLFQSIEKAGSFFLSRIKSNSNVRIAKIVAGNFSNSLIGTKLKDLVVKRRRSEIVEFLGQMTHKKQVLNVRIIGFWNTKERRYRWYITNLSASRKAISDLYRLRWQIELSFKSMKSYFNFDRIPTLSPNATTTLALIGVCHYVMSTILRLKSSQKIDGCTRPLSLLRSANIIRSFSNSIYSLFRSGYRMSVSLARKIDNLLLKTVKSYHDPNVKNRMNTENKLSKVIS